VPAAAYGGYIFQSDCRVDVLRRGNIGFVGQKTQSLRTLLQTQSTTAEDGSFTCVRADVTPEPISIPNVVEVVYKGARRVTLDVGVHAEPGHSDTVLAVSEPLRDRFSFYLTPEGRLYLTAKEPTEDGYDGDVITIGRDSVFNGPVYGKIDGKYPMVPPQPPQTLKLLVPHGTNFGRYEHSDQSRMVTGSFQLHG
jgi:hypothetical protein